MYTYNVTKRNKGTLCIQANNPKEAIAKLYKTSANNVELEKATAQTGEYCVECVNGKKKTANYYNIKDITFVSKAKEDPPTYMKRVRVWFDNQIDNWYQDHISEGDEDEEYYLYMDEYESTVLELTSNSLLFFGFCTGHYENAVDSNQDDDLTEDYYFSVEDMTDLLTEQGFSVGHEVIITPYKDENIRVVCKTITVEQFIKRLV